MARIIPRFGRRDDALGAVKSLSGVFEIQLARGVGGDGSLRARR